MEASEESLSAYGDEQAEYRSLDAQPSAQVDSLALSEGRQLPGEDAGLQMLLMSVPGQPGESELWLRVTTDDEDDAMPPAHSGKQRLSDAELAIVRRWIEQGAVYEDHWSFVPPTRPTPPARASSTRWGSWRACTRSPTSSSSAAA